MKVKKLKKFIIENSPTNEEIIKFINTPTVFNTKNGTLYRLDGKFHRTDGPAIEYTNGDREWYIKGLHHRTDGPAIDRIGGNKEWKIKGKRHRTDGPAVEFSNGAKQWYKHGKLHRVDGPAIEYADGTKMWYINGKLHRENSPAIEWSNGRREYWVNGERSVYGTSALKDFFCNYHRGITVSDSLSVTSSTSGFNYIVSDYCPSNTIITLGARYNPIIINIC